MGPRRMTRRQRLSSREVHLIRDPNCPEHGSPKSKEKKNEKEYDHPTKVNVLLNPIMAETLDRLGMRRHYIRQNYDAMEVPPTKEATKTQIYYAFLLGLSMLSTSVGFGYGPAAWISISQDKELELNSVEMPFLISSHFAGSILGKLIFSLLLRSLLLRPILAYTGFLSAICWFSMSCSTNGTIFLLVKALGGVLTGIKDITAYMYLHECITKNYHPKTKWVTSFFSNSGVFIMMILGAYLDWRRLALASCLLCIPGIIGAIYLTESPDALCRTYGWYHSLQSYQNLLGGENDESKLNCLINCAKIEEEKSSCSLYFDPDSVAYTVATSLGFWQSFTGIFVYISCLPVIMTEVYGLSRARNLCIGFAFIYSFMHLTCLYNEDAPRRNLLRISTVFMGSFSILVGIIFCIRIWIGESNNFALTIGIEIVTYLSLLGVFVCYCYGWKEIPSLYYKEVVPYRIIYNYSGSSQAIKSIISFILVDAFLRLRSNAWFFVYGVFTFLYLGVFHDAVFESFQKTSKQIEKRTQVITTALKSETSF